MNPLIGTPAEAFPVRVFLLEELAHRGWTAADVASRMPGSYLVNLLTIELQISEHCPDECIVGAEYSEALGIAFGCSPTFFSRLDASYHAWRAAVASPAATDLSTRIASASDAGGGAA